MSSTDYLILFGYFLFILVAANSFRRFTTDSSHYINGGGSMLWWMAGATAFMTQFSAWTFTGAASKAFTDGFPVLIIFWGNALGFFIAARFLAARYRKLRVETSMQVIAQRFGQPTERLFILLQLPLSTLTAAIWLNGLAYIIAAITGMAMLPILLLTGIVITFISASGGAWAVNATNVLQLVLLMTITLVTGGYALFLAGGPTEVIARFPVSFFSGSDINNHNILLLWVGCVLFQQVLSTNNANNSYRFLVTRHEADARKAALLAGMLFIIGPVMWFIPPWFTAGQGVDLQAMYPHLGQSAGNAAYLHFVINAMPQGTLGLILAAMIAATIAPMSTLLNRNAGILLRSLYHGPQHHEQHQLHTGRIFTVINGVIVILIAWWLSQQDQLGFFELVMLVGSLLQMPLTIPSVLAILVRRTPDWSGWSTVLVGLLVSLYMFIWGDQIPLPSWLVSTFPTNREAHDLSFALTIVAHVLITGGYFILTRLWYTPSRHSPQRARDLARLFINQQRPLQPQEIQPAATAQTKILSRLLLMLSLLLLPLPLVAQQRHAFLLHGMVWLCILLAGAGLAWRTAGKR
ncbi:hypothetical protein JGK42_002760 [Aeromonas veronii]|nr:hypothetical protein [Aeromonas veronii]